MGVVAYPDDEGILKHIVHRIEKMGGPARQAPTREQIEQLLSVAFAASLESEEHRPVTFSIFYSAEGCPCNYRFKEPSRFSAGALVRLSAALDSARSSIVVTSSADGLQVAGVWHGGSSQVGALSVRVFGPGVFLVNYNATLILTYRRGQYVPYPGTFDTLNAAAGLLSEPWPGHPDPARENHAVVCRFRVVEEMVRIGHGGTLLVVPGDVEWRGLTASQSFPPKGEEARIATIEARAYQTWVDRQASHKALTDDASSGLSPEERASHAALLLGGYEIRKDLAAELDALARLTATDGMVLVHPNLGLLGFGVFFKLGEVTCPIQVFDPYERATKTVAPLSALGGARHQSAAVAAANMPGTLAIVASSDGSVTTLRRTDSEAPLVVHKHLELRLPTWPIYQ